MNEQELLLHHYFIGKELTTVSEVILSKIMIQTIYKEIAASTTADSLFQKNMQL